MRSPPAWPVFTTRLRARRLHRLQPKPRSEIARDRVTDLVARQQSQRVDHFADGAEFRDYMKRNYGPTIAVYMGWEHLLVTARRV